MIILIHTSKTMRPVPQDPQGGLTKPIFLTKANTLAAALRGLSAQDIEDMMKVSAKLAGTTKELITGWSVAPAKQRAAIDSFLGDIYSGLQVSSWDEADRQYANQHLRILSGLYGVLRPLDGIYPYRFEMGYKLPGTDYGNLYSYWGSAIYDTLPKKEIIIDLTAVEYGKTVTKYAELSQIVTPRFLTISPKTGQPTFVVVHAKIARGAFAGWMIRNRIDTIEQLKDFAEIGYEYDESISTPSVPVYVCQQFKGLGLSVRLT